MQRLVKDVSWASICVFTTSYVVGVAMDGVALGHLPHEPIWFGENAVSALVVGAIFMWWRHRYYNSIRQFIMYEKQRKIRRYAIAQSLQSIICICDCNSPGMKRGVTREVTSIRSIIEDPHLPEEITNSHWFKEIQNNNN